MLTPEKGPQGGHHLWVAVRTKNLRQAGSTVAITAEQPKTGLQSSADRASSSRSSRRLVGTACATGFVFSSTMPACRCSRFSDSRST